MGGEMGRMRPTKVFERAGESWMTPPASSISSQSSAGQATTRRHPPVSPSDLGRQRNDAHSQVEAGDCF